MSILDSVIKLRAVEQEQANQTAEMFVKGLALKAEYDKNNQLAELEKQKTMASLAPHGLTLGQNGAITPNQGLIDTALQIKEKSEADKFYAEARNETAQAKAQKAKQEAALTNPVPVEQYGGDADKWLSEQFDTTTQQNIEDLMENNMTVKDITTRTGIGRRQIEGIAGMYAKAKGIDWNPVKNENAVAYKVDFTDANGFIRKNIQAGNKSAGHLFDMYRQGVALQNNSNQYNNALKNWAKNKLGLAGLTGARETQLAVADEMEKLLSTVGATQSGLEVRRENFDIGKASTAQMQDFIKANLHVMKRVLDTYGADYESVVGKKPDGKQLYTPETQKIFKAMGLMDEEGNPTEEKTVVEERKTKDGRTIYKYSDGSIGYAQ